MDNLDALITKRIGVTIEADYVVFLLIGNSTAILTVPTAASAGAYLLSTPVELGPVR